MINTLVLCPWKSCLLQGYKGVYIFFRNPVIHSFRFMSMTHFNFCMCFNWDSGWIFMVFALSIQWFWLYMYILISLQAVPFHMDTLLSLLGLFHSRVGNFPYTSQTLIFHDRPQFPLSGEASWFSLSSDNTLEVIMAPFHHHYNGLPHVLLNIMNLPFEKKKKVRAILQFDAILMDCFGNFICQLLISMM